MAASHRFGASFGVREARALLLPNHGSAGQCGGTALVFGGMAEHHIEIDTGEGAMGTYVVHSDREGPHPVVLFLMDAPGKRQLLHDMASRIANEGYYVMLPQLYYRTVPEFELDFDSRESLKAMFGLMGGVGNAMVGRDAGALLAHAEADPMANASRVGVVGYCMSGPFSLWVAAEHNDRVLAAASFYGVRLHVDASDSPHLRLGEINGEVYVAAAEHDDYIDFAEIDRLEAAMQAADVNGRVERFWDKHHGFAFDDRPAHDQWAEDRHWARLFDLFSRNLS